MTTLLRRADRCRWRAARNLAEFGDLVASWLTGEIASQPGYYGRVDVDEDYAPGLTSTLVALNRAGYVTNQSQAGLCGEGHDGTRWEQRAAVFGFADVSTAARLTDALAGTRFGVIGHPLGCRFHHAEPGVVVTTRRGQPMTSFGWQLHRGDLAAIYGDGCSRDMFAALCSAWQVTVYDPEWGANDLWPALRRAAASIAEERTAEVTR